MLLSVGASAQRVWTNVGANGVQRSNTQPPSSAPDTLYRNNLGASGFAYWRSAWKNNQLLQLKTDSLGNAIDAKNPIVIDTLANRLALSFDGYAPSLTDSLYHQSEGIVVTVPVTGEILNVYRRGDKLGHTGVGGDVYMRKSSDNGLTWGTPYLVYSSANDDRNVAGGITSDGRLVIWFARAGVDVGYVYSTNSSYTTFSSYTAVTLSGISQTSSAPFGKMVKNSAGKYLMPINNFWIAEIWESTDGMTWTFKTQMFDNTSFGNARKTSEVAIEWTGGNTMMAHVRNDVVDNMLQYTSTDNGATWVYVGVINYPSSVYASPTLYYDADRQVLVSFGVQRGGAGSTQELSLFTYVNTIADVFANSSGYSLQKKYVRPLPNYRTFYGYPSITKRADSNYLVIFTDDFSPLSVSTAASTERAYLYQFTIKYSPYNYNQQIPSEYSINNYAFNIYNGRYEPTPSTDAFVKAPTNAFLSRTVDTEIPQITTSRFFSYDVANFYGSTVNMAGILNAANINATSNITAGGNITATGNVLGAQGNFGVISGTPRGLIIRGYTSTSGAYGAIYPSTLTPSGSNYAFLANGTNTEVGASTNVYLSTASTIRATISSTGLALTGALSAASANLSGATASTIAGFDASKNIVSLATATYPGLTELSYVKGVTSPIQTQVNGKEPTITVLPIAKGGTGLTSIGTANQQLRVNAGATALEYFTPSASGTVTSVSVTAANGVSGSVATPTTTPAITLTLGNITPSNVNTSGSVIANFLQTNGGIDIRTNFGAYFYNAGNTFSSQLIAPTLTANRQVSLPNEDGTLITSSTVSGSTFVPTVTATSNNSSPSVSSFKYSRNGNIVTFSGKLTTTITTGGANAAINISLPIASTFATVEDVTGTVSAFNPVVLSNNPEIVADNTNNTIKINAVMTSSGANVFHFMGQYIIQ